MTAAQAARLEEQGDHAAAEQAYRQLLAGDPANVELLTGHAVACYGLREYEAAAAGFERAAQLAPGSATAHASLAIVYFRLGDMSKARAAYERAARLAPDDDGIRQAWHNLVSRPWFALTGFQGTHAPERQVFMSAVVDLLRRSRERLDILEIGSYMGSSLLTWANAVARLHGGEATIVCLDSWGLGETTPQYDERMAAALVTNRAHEVFLHNASLVPARIRVEPVRDLSERALPRLADRSFDIVYVDGCHLWREARIDVAEGSRLVRDGGILCGDDLELQVPDCDADHARAHANEDFIEDPRTGRHFHPGVTLAVHDVLGRVPAFSGFWAVRRDADRFTEVSFASARGIVPPHWPDELIARMREYFAGSPELGQLLD